MKTFYILLISSVVVSNITMAQAVGIGTTSPNASAVLDVVSTTKGFLMPRMTSTQRNAIASPAAGLTVYETTTSTIWVYNGSTWNQLASGAPQSSLWTASPTRAFVYNTTDSIGIGTSVPGEKLQVSNGNFKLNRTSLTAENSIIFNMPNPTLATETEGLKFQLSGADKSSIQFIKTVVGPPYPEGIRISGNGYASNDLFIGTNGNVGVGTNDPQNKFHVSGNVLMAGDATMNTTNPTLQLQNSSVNTGFLQLAGDNIRIGTNSGNTAGKFIIRNNGADRVFVDDNGRMGIGVTDPAATLHINSGSSIEALRITGNGASIIRMMTGGTDKANIYATGNDLNISTVQSNGLLRLNGEIFINNTANRTGIGTTTPDERLHVSGNIKVTGGKVLNSENINMIPVAIGYFNSLATKVRGTANISASRQTANSSFHYFDVTVAGADLTNAIINVTGIGPQTWASVGGITGNTVSVLVYENIVSQETKWSPFYIVIYN